MPLWELRCGQCGATAEDLRPVSVESSAWYLNGWMIDHQRRFHPNDLGFMHDEDDRREGRASEFGVFADLLFMRGVTSCR